MLERVWRDFFRTDDVLAKIDEVKKVKIYKVQFEKILLVIFFHVLPLKVT